MPIFGRYLLKNYLKVLLLSLFSFIAILLVSRLEEIAEFAAMGVKASYLALFTLYQVSYILPIAIPLSCLISAMILFQHLSHTFELTALRASGISLYGIIAPVLVAGAFLGLGNFYFTSELATISHLAARRKIYDHMSINPILLLQNARIANLQGAFVQMDPQRSGKEAKDLIIVLNNRSNEQTVGEKCGLGLGLAKKIKMNGEELIAKEVSFISSLPCNQSETFDHLIIENQKRMSTSASELVQMLGKRGWKIANDHLTFSLLRIRKALLAEKYATEINAQKKKNIKRHLEKSRTEIVRRISLGVATFTFTLMGVSYGMEISRRQTKRGILSVLILTALTLIAFFMGKELDHLFGIASCLFLLPHFLILLCSAWTLRRVNRGVA